MTIVLISVSECFRCDACGVFADESNLCQNLGCDNFMEVGSGFMQVEMKVGSGNPKLYAWLPG